MKIGKKFLKMVPLYKMFAQNLPGVTFTQQDLEEAYRVETHGSKAKNGPSGYHTNGYIWGKQYLNLQVTSWKEDIRDCYVHMWEIYEDPKFIPFTGWLDNIFRDVRINHHKERHGIHISKEYDKEYIISKILRRFYEEVYPNDPR